MSIIDFALFSILAIITLLIAKVHWLQYSIYMDIVAPIILCFIPYIAVFVLFALLVPNVKVRSELWASIIGIICVLPISFIQFVVLEKPVFNSYTIYSVLLRAVVFNGIIEEGIKGLFLFFIPSKNKKLAPFFCYALISGMILGSFESVIYLLRELQTVSLGSNLSLLKLIYLRMGTSVVVHTLCSGLLGLGVYTVRNKMPHMSPFVYAILIHGLYDFFVRFNSPIKYFSFAAILLAIAECRIWYVRINSRLSNAPGDSALDKDIAMGNATVMQSDATAVQEKTVIAPVVPVRRNKPVSAAKPKSTAKVDVKKKSAAKPEVKKQSVAKSPIAEKKPAKKSVAKKTTTKAKSNVAEKPVKKSASTEKKVAVKKTATKSAGSVKKSTKK